MADQSEPARQQMRDAGVPEEHHDELAALRGPLSARGVDWLAVLDLLAKVQEVAPAVIDALKRLRGNPSEQI